MPLTAKISVAIDALLTAVADIGVVSHAINYGPSTNLADGTGAGQANQAFTDTRTLAASATENLDLSGVLTNAFGTAIAFTKVKAILIVANAANTNDVVVGGAASNQWVAPWGTATDKINIKPGGLFLLTAPDANGLAVVAGTGDLLKVANGGAGTGVTYDILILGIG